MGTQQHPTPANRPDEMTGDVGPAAALGNVFSRPRDHAVTPLGRLYRRDVARLARHHPTLSLSQRDWIVVLSLALAFTNLEGAELAHAMWDGSPYLRSIAHNGGSAEDGSRYVQDVVLRALGTAQRLTKDSP